MLFLALLITAFTAVLTQDLLGVSYYFDSSYTNNFCERKCENTTRWELVSYEYLELISPYQLSSKAIKASGNSCTSSFPIMFFNGTLELTVFLRTVSKYSGITIALFDGEDNVMEAVRYQRSNKNFVTGWTVISLPIKRHTTGFIQISGQSLTSELIIIDSLRYTPSNTTTFEDTENIQDFKKSAVLTTTNTLEDEAQIESLEVEFLEVEDNGGSEEDEDDIDGSGGWEPDPDPEEPGSSTDEPESEEVVDENSDDPGFWNAFTITLVSVGTFVVVGSIGVGSYYLGKNRGISETPPIDIDALEAPSVITVPRVRSIFSDAPSERFSRFS